MECMRPGVFDSLRLQIQQRNGSRDRRDSRHATHPRPLRRSRSSRHVTRRLRNSWGHDAISYSRDHPDNVAHDHVFYTSGLPPLSGRWRRTIGGGIEDDPVYLLVPGSDRDDASSKDGDGEESQCRTWREICMDTFTGKPFQMIMAGCIMMNALVIGLETDIPDFKWWNFIERVFLIIFSFELCFRLAIVGLGAYFDPNGPDFTWNVFDFFVVFLGLCDAFMSVVAQTQGGTATLFRIIRLLRVLRMFRIVRFLKQLYKMAFGFGLASVAIFWVTILAGFLLYLCSVILVRTVGHLPLASPHQAFFNQRFGSIPRSMFTLFELMASPDLSPYHETWDEYPPMSLFLIFFIVFGSFGMIALLTGVISESMFDKNQIRVEEQLMERIETRRLVVDHCSELFDTLDVDHDGAASREELHKLLPQMSEFFEHEGLDCVAEDLDVLMHILDADLSGSVNREEFCNGMMHIAEGVRPLMIIETSFMVKYLKQEILNIKKQSEATSCRLTEHLEKVDGKIDELIAMQSGQSNLQVRTTSETTDAASLDLLSAFGKVHKEVQKVLEYVLESDTQTIAVKSGGSETCDSKCVRCKFADADILGLFGAIHADIQRLLVNAEDAEFRVMSNELRGTGSFNVAGAPCDTLHADRFGLRALREELLQALDDDRSRIGALREGLLQLLKHRDDIALELQAVERGLAEVSATATNSMTKVVDGQQHLCRMMETFAVELTRLRKEGGMGCLVPGKTEASALPVTSDVPGILEAVVKDSAEAVRKDYRILQHNAHPKSMSRR